MADFDIAFSQVKAILPQECITQEREDLISHGRSSWTYHDPKVLPGAVLYPRHTEDVIEIMEIAYKYAIPVVAFSGGTSLEGHFDAPSFPLEGFQLREPISLEDLKAGPSFVVDFSANMNEIVEVHDMDMDVVVQPGMPYEVLNEELKSRDLFFPVDPGPGAEIGGMVATGCSGTNAVRYGTMRDNVLNLTVVLPNGEVVKTRSRARKSSAGPDLTKLFIGSEGTLGLVVEATLKLAPLLPFSVAVSAFPDIQAAADTVKEVVQSGVLVQCIEILDDLMMKAINKAEANNKNARQWQEAPSLFFKFNGSAEQMRLDMHRTAEIVKRHRGSKLITATSEDEKENLWRARKIALWSALAYYPGSRCWTTDVCVPISKFPDLVHETKEDLLRLNIVAPIVGHAGDGNFHGLLLFRTPEEFERVKEAVHNMIERAQRLDGTCTGEHGVGHGKIKYLVNELGEGTVEILRQIKRQLDPKNIMNPGKLVSIQYAE
ncbi:MAG: hypothetical protein CYPHOPRED_002683 [Cyphobasidiales sp. Tagirdzhanova-0007]|nr:MAG: hypothetical protein CYPHOPRED_002683 [Cyphobasidiales sp. Tagirdzhanova-0007]